jgi:hypothetical protein
MDFAFKIQQSFMAETIQIILMAPAAQDPMVDPGLEGILFKGGLLGFGDKFIILAVAFEVFKSLLRVFAGVPPERHLRKADYILTGKFDQMGMLTNKIRGDNLFYRHYSPHSAGHGPIDILHIGRQQNGIAVRIGHCPVQNGYIRD